MGVKASGVLGDTASLLAMARIDVPPWRSWMNFHLVVLCRVHISPHVISSDTGLSQMQN